jgi:hypothetical protein
MLTARGVSEGGGSPFCKDAKTDMMTSDTQGRQSTSWLRILASRDKKLFHSVYPIVDALGVSRSTILNYLQESLGMKIFHLSWIPNELTDS